MNANNSLALYEAFPRLYRGRAKPLTESLMAFGFECGNGWFQIIWDLSAAIEKLAVEEGHADEGWPEVVQVKEKFGTLSFYVHGAVTDEMWNCIQEANCKSAHTCEVCGAPGKLYTSGWLYTACPEHAKER